MKYVKYLLLIIVVVLCIGCTSKTSNLKSLSYSELNSKLKNKEDFFFVVTQDGCSHCEDFVPVLEEVLNEKNVIGYNFNITKLSEKEKDEFDKLFEVDGTPTTIFIKDGAEVSLLQRINGEASKDKVIQKLKNNGYLK